MQLHPPPDTEVTIPVAPGISFAIARHAYAQALTQATILQKVMFVGLMRDGQSLVSHDRDVLRDLDCTAIAWVTPGCAL